MLALLVGVSACGDDPHAGGRRDEVIATTIAVTFPRTTEPSPTIGMIDDETDLSEEQRRAVIESVLASHARAGEFVGARIALADTDGSVIVGTSGRSGTDVGSGSVDPDVPWNIGSVTKVFVAVVVMQLAAEGVLDLDAGIDPYMPDLADAASITPRHLLQHTSGLAEYIDQSAIGDDAQRPWSPHELIAVAESAGRVGMPGGAHHYANTNFIVLGEVIAAVTGRSWDAEVEARVSERLGLTSTGLITVGVSAPGFVSTDGAFVEVSDRLHPSIGGAAGALQSTGEDLVRFARALTDGTLVPALTVHAMEQVVPGQDLSAFGVDHGYGLGLERYAAGELTIFGHLGSGAAHSAFLGYDRESGTFIAVAMNVDTPGPQAVMALEVLTALALERESGG
jgi:D-alanyl-D-alanine carboxypeptidase